MTLAKAFEAEPQLPEIYEADEEVKALIDMARKLEGVTRNAGKHAGGVVIAPTKITDFAPLYCDEEGKHTVTQFDKSDVRYATGEVRLPWFAYAHHHQLGAGGGSTESGGRRMASRRWISPRSRWMTRKASTCCNARKPLRYSSLNRAA